MDKNDPFPTCFAGHPTKTPVNSEFVIRLEERRFLSSQRSTVQNSDTSMTSVQV